MKIPSIFRLPNYQRFDIQPRYYDPIKEEIEEKHRKVRRVMALNKKDGISNDMKPGERLEGAFLKQAPRKDNSTQLRLILGAVMFGGTVAYLYFGEWAIYITVGVVISYLAAMKFGLLKAHD
jgi:hypothetical protein